jgi:hypothetical protein
MDRCVKTDSVAFSPQANCTDWATATCWRNLVPTLADRGVLRDQRGGSRTAVNLSCLDRSVVWRLSINLKVSRKAINFLT